MKIRTLVILIVGTAWNSAFEIYAHSISAKYLGWSEPTINLITSGQQPDQLTASEAAAYKFTYSLVHKRKVDDGVYSTAVSTFTHKGVVELTELIGIFLSVSAILNTFEIPVPDVNEC